MHQPQARKARRHSPHKMSVQQLVPAFLRAAISRQHEGLHAAADDGFHGTSVDRREHRVQSLRRRHSLPHGHAERGVHAAVKDEARQVAAAAVEAKQPSHRARNRCRQRRDGEVVRKLVNITVDLCSLTTAAIAFAMASVFAAVFRPCPGTGFHADTLQAVPAQRGSVNDLSSTRIQLPCPPCVPAHQTAQGGEPC